MSIEFTLLLSQRVDIDTTPEFNSVDVNANHINVSSSKTPASATAAGTAGDIAWDTNYLYICVATNTWRRRAINTWS